MTRHALKVWPSAYVALLCGRKTFEWRRDDRGFKVGDELELHLWCPITESYLDANQAPCSHNASAKLLYTVTYVLRGQFGVPDGFCIMSLRNGGAAPTSALAVGSTDTATGTLADAPACDDVKSPAPPQPPAERIRDLEKALRGLLQDVMEVREATGAYEAQDPSGPEPGTWWDERVTAGLHHIHEAQKLLGEELEPS